MELLLIVLIAVNITIFVLSWVRDKKAKQFFSRYHMTREEVDQCV